MSKTSASSFLTAILFSAEADAENPTGASSSVAAPTYMLTLTVEGVRAAEGEIMAQLLKADHSTGKAPPLLGIQAPATAGVTTLTFTGLEASEQAFANYGADWLVEDHVFVPKRGGSGEDDGWLLGTAVNWKRQKTALNILDARDPGTGPIARTWLEEPLPLGFHGQFVQGA